MCWRWRGLWVGIGGRGSRRVVRIVVVGVVGRGGLVVTGGRAVAGGLAVAAAVLVAAQILVTATVLAVAAAVLVTATVLDCTQILVATTVLVTAPAVLAYTQILVATTSLAVLETHFLVITMKTADTATPMTSAKAITRQNVAITAISPVTAFIPVALVTYSN